MAETIGSLVDKLSIVELKIFHMREQVAREDRSADFHVTCRDRLTGLQQQREDLAVELTQLLQDLATGARVPKVNRQCKMYNDPVYRRDG